MYTYTVYILRSVYYPMYTMTFWHGVFTSFASVLYLAMVSAFKPPESYNYFVFLRAASLLVDFYK